MDPKSGLRVFLDTSAIFAAVLSPSGGARKLYRAPGTGHSFSWPLLNLMKDFLIREVRPIATAK